MKTTRAPRSDLPPLPWVELTPLLKKERPLGDTLKQLLLGAGASLVVGIRLILFVHGHRAAARAVGLSSGDTMLAIPLMIVAYLAVTLAHEGGHTTFGVLNGMQFGALWAGPFLFRNSNGRIRVGWNKSLWAAGGLALCFPAPWKGRDDYRRRFTWMVAGGPIGSFLIAAASLIVVGLRVANGDTGTDAHWLSFTLMIGAVMAAGMGIVTLIPVQVAGVPFSDGSKLRWLVGAARDDDDAFLPYMALRLFGLRDRPAEWSGDLVQLAERVTARADNLALIEAGLKQLLAMRALECGEMEKARALIEASLDAVARSTDRTTRASWGEATINAALFEAVVRGDAESAKRWLGAHERLTRPDTHGVAVVTAALLVLSGELSGAADAVRKAEGVASRNGGWMRPGRQWLVEQIAPAIHGAEPDFAPIQREAGY